MATAENRRSVVVPNNHRLSRNESNWAPLSSVNTYISNGRLPLSVITYGRQIFLTAIRVSIYQAYNNNNHNKELVDKFAQSPATQFIAKPQHNFL